MAFFLLFFNILFFAYCFLEPAPLFASPAWGAMLCAKNQLKIHQIINKSTAQRNRQAGVKQ